MHFLLAYLQQPMTTIYGEKEREREIIGSKINKDRWLEMERNKERGRGTVGTERNGINDLDLFIECHISPLYFIWCISNIVLSDSDEYPATSA